MSSPIIPSISPDFLHTAFTLDFPPADDGLFAWAESNSVSRSYAEWKIGNEPARLVFSLEPRKHNQAVTARIEVAREAFRPGTSISTDDIVKKITDLFARTSGQQCALRTSVRVRVARSDIPEHGMIAGLLRASWRAGTALLSVRGSVLEIEDQVFSRLTFNQSYDKSNVFVELYSSSDVTIGPTTLTLAHELMFVGVERFVFERITREASACPPAQQSTVTT